MRSIFCFENTAKKMIKVKILPVTGMGMVGGGRVGRTITDPPIEMSAQALGDFVFGFPHPPRLASVV